MKNQSFALLLAGMITIVVLAIIFDRCEERKLIIPPVIDVKAQIDSVKAHEFKLQPIVDSLNVVTGRLYEKDILNKKSLAFLQSENRRLAKIAERHIDSMGLFEPPDSNENDYAGNTKELIDAAAAADSACNVRVSGLDSINITQGKTIVLKDSMYNSLKRSFNASIEQQNNLNDINSHLQKEVKKKTTLNKVLGAAALVGAGFIIKSIIK